MLEILRQLRLRGARRPVAEDGAGCPGSGGALFVANDDFPGAHFPLFDQTTHDVRIFPGEFFNLAPVIDSKYQQSTVDGIIERARERSEEHTSELQSRLHLVCRLLLEKKKTTYESTRYTSYSQSSTTLPALAL